MKEKLYNCIIYITGVLVSLLFIYSGTYLMTNFSHNDIIFGIGLLGSMFGGYGFFKMMFEYKWQKKHYHNQPCDCDICHYQKKSFSFIGKNPGRRNK